jgi:hypothetical protein
MNTPTFLSLTLVQLGANGTLPPLDGRGPNLAAKEQFLPRYAAGLDGLPDLRLVTVKLRAGRTRFIEGMYRKKNESEHLGRICLTRGGGGGGGGGSRETPRQNR